MPLYRYDELLLDAKKKKYAVGAFNIFSLEFLPSILKAAEEEKSPILLQINPIHYRFFDLAPYLNYIKTQIGKAAVPVGLNLDHGSSKEIIIQGIQAGFPSVMFDGSKLPFKENKLQTRDIAKICQMCNVTLEAELGTLNDEGLELTQENQNLLFTDPEMATEFVEETGVDALAVAIGNAHGVYKGEPNLDFDRLKKISNNVKVPLVLHGGSGLSVNDFRRAIALGICKVNIYTEMSLAAYTFAQNFVQKSEQVKDYPTLLYEARTSVYTVVKAKMRVFGSSGKA